MAQNQIVSVVEAMEQVEDTMYRGVDAIAKLAGIPEFDSAQYVYALCDFGYLEVRWFAAEQPGKHIPKYRLARHSDLGPLAAFAKKVVPVNTPGVGHLGISGKVN